ncbi:MAG: hypothetical protein FWD05_04990 [Oscillospiraceae bacterium]|nr:hypothetical protein [Oscillospiraceae bacterium]
MSKRKRIWRFGVVVTLILSIVMTMMPVISVAAQESPIVPIRDGFTEWNGTVGQGEPAAGQSSLQHAINLGYLVYNPETKSLSATPAVTAAANRISEYVFIEVPTDTDNDGQRDLIRVHINRPAVSGPGSDQIRVPVSLAISPYTGTAIETICENHHFNTWVEEFELADLTEDGFIWPAAGSRQLTVPQQHQVRLRTYGMPVRGIEGDTTHYTYAENVQSRKPRSWQWGHANNEFPAADVWGGEQWKYIDDCGCVMIVPATRGDREVAPARRLTGAAAQSPAALHAVGFAHIQSATFNGMVGNTLVPEDSGDRGFNQGSSRSGDVEQSILTVAIAKWLNGEVKAFTDWAATNEVVADWSNGNMSSTGTSYPGTLPIGAATTGYSGLKAIMPIAALASAYQYNRNNGGVFQSVQEQGSGRNWIGSYNVAPSVAMATNPVEQRLLNNFLDLTRCYDLIEERLSGAYNAFWDTSNYLVDVPQMTAGILIQQPTMDYNVEMSQADMFWRALVRENPDYPVKMFIYHQQHTSANTINLLQSEHQIPHVTGHMSINQIWGRWNEYWVWGLQNDIMCPSVPNVWAVDTVTGDWDAFDTWPMMMNDDGSDTVRRYYLNSTVAARGGTLTPTPPEATVMPTITDPLRRSVYARLTWEEPPLGGGGGANMVDRYAGGGNNLNAPGGVPRTRRKGRDQIMGNIWQDTMLRTAAFEEHSNARLAFVTAPFETDVLLTGTPVVTLELASDQARGTVSVAIVDLGEVYPIRGFTYLTSSVDGGQTFTSTQNNGNAFAIGTRNGVPSRFTPRTTRQGFSEDYFIMSRAQINLTNPNPSGLTYVSPEITAATGMTAPFYYQTKNIQPGVFYTYTVPMHANHYIFRAGSQLAVYVFTNDYRYGTINLDPPAVNVRLGPGSFIELPLTEALPTGAPVLRTPLSTEAAIEVAEAYRAAHGEILTIDIDAVTRHDRLAAVRAWDAYQDQPIEVRELLQTEIIKIIEVLERMTADEFLRRANSIRATGQFNTGIGGVGGTLMAPNTNAGLGTASAALHAGVTPACVVRLLGMTPEAVQTSDRVAIWRTWSFFNGLHIGIKNYMRDELILVRSLLEALVEMELGEADAFRATHARVLNLNVNTVRLVDKPDIQAALDEFDALPFGVAAHLVLVEQPLLVSLLEAAVIPQVFSGTSPNALARMLEEGDVILATTPGNLGIFAHQSPFVIPEGRTLTVTTVLNVQQNATLVIEGNLVVAEDGRVNNQGSTSSGGTIVVAASGTLTNYGWVENVTNSTVRNYGTIVNEGRFAVRARTNLAHVYGSSIEGSVPLNVHRDANEEVIIDDTSTDAANIEEAETFEDYDENYQYSGIIPEHEYD